MVDVEPETAAAVDVGAFEGPVRDVRDTVDDVGAVELDGADEPGARTALRTPSRSLSRTAPRAASSCSIPGRESAEIGERRTAPASVAPGPSPERPGATIGSAPDRMASAAAPDSAEGPEGESTSGSGMTMPRRSIRSRNERAASAPAPVTDAVASGAEPAGEVVDERRTVEEVAPERSVVRGEPTRPAPGRVASGAPTCRPATVRATAPTAPPVAMERARVTPIGGRAVDNDRRSDSEEFASVLEPVLLDSDLFEPLLVGRVTVEPFAEVPDRFVMFERVVVSPGRPEPAVSRAATASSVIERPDTARLETVRPDASVERRTVSSAKRATRSASDGRSPGSGAESESRATSGSGSPTTRRQPGTMGPGTFGSGFSATRRATRYFAGGR